MSFDDIRDLALSYGDQSGYPNLGFNPAPGKPDVVSRLAQDFTTVSGHLGHAHEAMTKAGQAGGFWEGEAAQNFHKQIGELPDYLDKATRSLGDAGKALTGWHDDLSSMQQTAADYERQAAAAQQSVQQAKNNPDLGLANQQFDNQAALDAAQSKLNAATGTLNTASKELDDIREQASRLFKQHQDLVKQVEDALKHAKDIAPDKPGLFDRIGDALSKVVNGIKDLAKKTWKWVQDHADLIAKIGDVLSTVGSVLGVIAIATAWIPGVDVVTAAAAAGVSAAAAGTKLLAKAAGADVSWGSIAMDAVGVIPGGKMVAGAKNAVTQAARSSKLLSKVPVLGMKEFKVGEQAFKPIKFSSLRNPGQAIDQAAQTAHANAVNLANKITRSSIDPFSTKGIVTGAIVQTPISQGIKEGIHYGTDKITGDN